MKRFTCTEKWDKDWFVSLSPKQKCLWQFILDRCDSAGVWSPAFKLASFCIGETVVEEDMGAFGSHTERLPNGKYWVPDFIGFQYGQLSTACKPHKKAIGLLEPHGLMNRVKVFKGLPKGNDNLRDTLGNSNDTPPERLPKGNQRVQEEEEDKEEDKEEGVEGEKHSKPVIENPGFLQFWEAYPRKEKKGDARKAFVKALQKTSLGAMLEAIQKQKLSHGWTKDGGQFIPHPTTWLNGEQWDNAIFTPTTKPKDRVENLEMKRLA